MQCSLSKRRFTSPSPPPNHPFFSMLVVFKNYSSLLVTVLSLVSQDCYCPSRASSLIDQLLNLILRKRQHFNFLWRVDALFLGLPAPCVSMSRDTAEGSHLNNNGPLGQPAQVYLQKEKWFHRASHPQNCRLLQGSAPSAGCLLHHQHHFCITTPSLSADSKEGCPPFLPPPLGHEWHSVPPHSWLHWMRHQGRGKEEKERGKEERKEDREGGSDATHHSLQLENAAPQSQCGNSLPYRGKLWERELGWRGGWMGTGVEHTHREWRRLCEISVP